LFAKIFAPKFAVLFTLTFTLAHLAVLGSTFTEECVFFIILVAAKAMRLGLSVMPFSKHHVHRVVSVSPHLQMIWVNALRIVAFVANKKAFRNRAVVDFV
jgi:hypothetical protein